MSINKLIKTEDFITGISRPDMKEVPASAQQWEMDGFIPRPCLALIEIFLSFVVCKGRLAGGWWVVLVLTDWALGEPALSGSGISSHSSHSGCQSSGHHDD